VLAGTRQGFHNICVEQSSALRFNRGMLLNTGVTLLAGSSYDYFVFHDVDTTPTEVGGLPYDYPYGPTPCSEEFTVTLLLCH